MSAVRRPMSIVVSAVMVASLVSFSTPEVAQAAPINTNSIAAVWDAYNKQYVANASVAANWVGNEANCDAGSVSQKFIDAQIAIMNYYRGLAGLPGVTENKTASAAAQQTALLMDANDSISHYPATSWQCYTAEAGKVAAQSNLAATYNYLDLAALDMGFWMDDLGGSNAPVGHRRWILYPKQLQVGIGNTDGANFRAGVMMLWGVFGMQGGSLTKDVGWPSAGYFPYENLPTVSRRWSFSKAGTDFTNRTVTVTKNGESVPVTIESSEVGYGDNAIVWLMPAQNAPTGGKVDVYNVTISGVTSYDVKVFKASDPLAMTITDISVTQPQELRVGAVVNVTANGSWPAEAIVSYQWYRGSAAINGAVANSYTITTADAGALLRVIAKVSYPGLAAVTKEYKVGIPLAEGQYFVDILTTHVLAERIGWLFEEGITLGYQTQYGAEYRPNNSVTRAEMATFMYRLAGSPAFSAPVKSPFTDVSPSAGSYKAVAWLVDKKISSGYQGASGAEYRPNNSVTRAEMATFLYRLAGSPAFNAPQKSSFADVSVGAGYFKAMEWLVAQGVTSGYQGASGAEYRPNNSVTRGEMATFLWRMDSKELVTSAS